MVSTIGRTSLNSVLAASFSNVGKDAAIKALKESDAKVKSQAETLLAKAGVAATGTVQLNYTTGPDGQLYATSASVSSSKKTIGTKGLLPNNNNPLDNQQNAPYSSEYRQKQSLTEILRPKANLTPSQEAEIFGSAEFNAQSDRLTHLQRIKLSQADLGVRIQENNHFRQAAGLGEIPTFDVEIGENGELIAVAGKVDVRPTGGLVTPEQAQKDASKIAAAAFSATDASAQDIAVGAKAQTRAALLYAYNNNLKASQDFVVNQSA